MRGTRPQAVCAIGRPLRVERLEEKRLLTVTLVYMGGAGGDWTDNLNATDWQVLDGPNRIGSEFFTVTRRGTAV